MESRMDSFRTSSRSSTSSAKGCIRQQHVTGPGTTNHCAVGFRNYTQVSVLIPRYSKVLTSSQLLKTSLQPKTARCTVSQGSATQRSTAQHSTAQHSTAQHSTAQHSMNCNNSALQYITAQHSTAPHSTARTATTVHCNTAQHSTAQHSTAQHSTAHL